ncbi:MAG: DUF4199 domain-containing protein [Pseudomonadota bacterium]
MQRIALTYGAISGLIIIVSILLNHYMSDSAGSEWLGYLIMILALSAVFFGVKQHRDGNQGGVIRFWPAFGVGILISLVASLVYVVVWEVYLAVSGIDFAQTYADELLAKKEAAGATEDELAKAKEKMDRMVAQYANPLFRIPVTFSEIFPVGAVVSLISAFILRNPKGKRD